MRRWRRQRFECSSQDISDNTVAGLQKMYWEFLNLHYATCNSSTLVAVCSSKFANSTYDLSWVSLNPENATINHANGSIAMANTTSTNPVTGTSTTGAVARNSEINLNHHSALLLTLMAALVY